MPSPNGHPLRFFREPPFIEARMDMLIDRLVLLIAVLSGTALH